MGHHLRARTLLIAFALAYIFAPSASLAAPNPAPKPPTYQLCLATNGTIVAKPRCKASEFRVSAETIAAIGASSSTQGPAGPQGPRGTLDPARCISRRTEWNGNTLVTGRVECAAGEFLLTHGVETTSVQSDVISIALLYLPGINYPTGVAYETGTNGGAINYTIRVTGVCCLP